jgi:hypothetical protein
VIDQVFGGVELSSPIWISSISSIFWRWALAKIVTRGMVSAIGGDESEIDVGFNTHFLTLENERMRKVTEDVPTGLPSPEFLTSAHVE